MNKIIISATSYLNTVPFVYGIENSGFIDNYELKLDVPAKVAETILLEKADIGLLPVGVIPEISNYKILNSYCIGAEGKVKTVILFSHKPLKDIKNIALDYESRTSVVLARILAHNYWKLNNIKWLNLNNKKDYLSQNSIIAIGDKTFEMDKHYEYSYDLAEEWQKWTGLPFVFACWVAKKSIKEDIINNFEKALGWGVELRSEIASIYKNKNNSDINIKDYFEKNISFNFDEKKHFAMQKFLSYF